MITGTYTSPPSDHDEKHKGWRFTLDSDLGFGFEGSTRFTGPGASQIGVELAPTRGSLPAPAAGPARRGDTSPAAGPP